MPNDLLLLMLLGPLALVLTAALAATEPGVRPRRVLFAARAATVLPLVLAISGGVALALNGSATTGVIGAAGIGFSVQWDALSAVMFGLVSFVGAIVVQYSRNYLDGDPRHGAFMGGLCLTLAAVLLLVVSGNLVQLVLAWIATSLALHRLLVFYRDRPAAVLAARKKFIAARIGDACLVVAAVLLWQAFGTPEIAAILDGAEALAGGDTPTGVYVAALFIVLAALLKSAQFPFHGWLPEVMETPTPVSALLHAGIINAGGFLVVRFADVMLLSVGAMDVLAVVGGFTALFGAVAMLTQTSVKVSLAFSTMAQMGFMLLQCGLGAFSAAVLHIVAHSLYKAHAFLSAGSVVDLARASWVPVKDRQPHPLRLIAGLGSALAIFVGIGALLGVGIENKPAIVALGAILVMGLTLLIAQSLQGQPNSYVIGRTLMAAAGTAFAYFVLIIGTERLLAGAVPEAGAAGGPVHIAIMVLMVGLFAAVTVLQLVLPYRTASPRWRAAYVHLANGLYANALFNRIIGALRRSASARA